MTSVSPSHRNRIVAGIARRAGVRVHADGGEDQAVEADDEAAEDVVAAGDERDEGDAEQREEEELGRAERQHDRLEDRDHDGEDAGADDAADARCRHAGAERAPGFALLGHRIAVDGGGGVVAVARHAEHDAGDLAAGAVDGMHGQQEDGARDHLHAEHERDGERDRQPTADAGRDADDQPDQHGDQHQPHDLGRGQHRVERAEHDFKHTRQPWKAPPRYANPRP